MYLDFVLNKSDVESAEKCLGSLFCIRPNLSINEALSFSFSHTAVYQKCIFRCVHFWFLNVFTLSMYKELLLLIWRLLELLREYIHRLCAFVVSPLAHIQMSRGNFRIFVVGETFFFLSFLWKR